MVNERYDAVVLAGGKIKGKYARVTGQTIKALIAINGETCLSRVLTALRSSKYINRIVVVGPQEIQPELSQHRVDKFIPAGKTGEDNIFLGANAIDYTGKFIFCCSDIPFICGQDIDEFIELSPAETIATYPVFERKYISQAFPEAKIKYVPLHGGAYTGGNLFLVHTDLFGKYKELIIAVFRVRKSQFGMCRLLEFPLVMKFLFRQLTIPEIEDKASELLGGKIKAITNASPNFGLDIDLLREYYTVLKIAHRE